MQKNNLSAFLKDLHKPLQVATAAAVKASFCSHMEKCIGRMNEGVTMTLNIADVTLQEKAFTWKEK